MAGYVVTAAAVRVVVESSDLLLERGKSLPAGVDAATVKRLLGKGMVAKVADPEPEAAQSDEPKPLGQLKSDELKAYAAEKSIDLAGASTKAEMVAAIEAAEKAAASGDESE